MGSTSNVQRGSTASSFLTVSLFLGLLSGGAFVSAGEVAEAFHPRAIPLFSLSPNLQAWMRADDLHHTTATHWFEAQMSPITAFVRIDGGPVLRVLGEDSIPSSFATALRGEEGTDRPGKDLPGSPIQLPLSSTSSDCALLCSFEPLCLSWSFLPHNQSVLREGNHRSSDVSHLCSLRVTASSPVVDLSRSSGAVLLHWNASDLDGTPKTDRGGNRAGFDLTSLSMPPSARPSDCARQCWLYPNCFAWVFAHSGCGNVNDTYCWLKLPGSTALPADDCRQSGLAPPALGWQPVPFSIQPALPLLQVSLTVQPTQTIALFSAAGVQLTLTFTQPAFPDDLQTSSSESVYISFDLSSTDQGTHSVEVYFDAASELVTDVVSSPQDEVEWSDVSGELKNLTEANVRAYSMAVPNAVPFHVRGDENRGDWGVLYVSSGGATLMESTVASAEACRTSLFNRTAWPPLDERKPRLSLGSGPDMPTIAFMHSATVDGSHNASAFFTLFYDEVESVQFFGQSLPPYWLHLYGDWQHAVAGAINDYPSIRNRADEYDRGLMSNMTRLVGKKWTALLALIHRDWDDYGGVE